MLLKTAKSFFSKNIHTTAYHAFHREKDGSKKVYNDHSLKWKEHNTHKKDFDLIYSEVPRPAVGMGIICGQISNIFVVDFDDKDLAHEMMNKFPEDKKTMFQETKKGYHFFYAFDNDFSTRKIGLGGLQLDIISGDTLLYHFPSNGYTLKERPILPISEGFKNHLLSLKPEENKIEKKFKDTPKGGRNDTCFKFLSGIQGQQNPNLEELTKAAHTWNNQQTDPLGNAELLKIVESVGGRYVAEGEKPQEKKKPKALIQLDNEDYKYWYNPVEEKYIEYDVKDNEMFISMSKQGFTQALSVTPKDCSLPNIYHHFSFRENRFSKKGVKNYFNEYKEPAHMGLKKVEPEPDYKDLLDRFMLHISCYDPELKKYLDQWLAYLYQKGLTPKTALLMRGVQGTGKGTLFNLLKNLFDSKYVMQLTCDIVNEKYNSFLMRNRICVINEIPSDDKELTVFSNKVKTWITDDSQAIREIYKPVVVAEINTAFIANSNFARSLILEGSDRRWTIFSYNQEPISSHFSGPELDLLNSKDISEEFAKYLSCVEIKKHPTEKGILVPERYFKTDAKTNLTEDSETIAQRIVSALSKKDLGYFDENLEDYKLMNQLNICFKKNLIPTFVIINILEKAGKHTNSFTVHNILKRTQFSDFFKKKAFRLGGMETGSHSFKGFEFKDDVPYKLDYSNHEVKTQESTRI